ncbi:hypothetical protein BDV36DRAFT_279149 [Aspergillus pseudocaelatus]|uniref:Sodium/calcium exchanger membrane region domain-containing protein n=1 Tax=Aspergillus pseudocaelatus TaxID=1825620 RepID=A0ABQ6X2U4_9EURO|nr:hypothetical protein BDV36DRAFT_279149 [Aspergillus pseudocaelatus]
MLDDLSSKGVRAQCGKSVTQPGPSPCDLRTWYQELIVTTVYKCHFIGVAYLVLLSIVVSWGNLIVPWVIYPVAPVTSAGSLNVSVNTITLLSTSTLFTYCTTVERLGLRESNIATSVLLLVGNSFVMVGLAQPFCLSIPSKFSESAALGQFVNPSLAKILDDIPRIILIISTISLLAIIPLFFHSKPLTAPSIATADVAKKRNFWLLSLLFSIYVVLFNSTIILINKEVGVIERILISAGLLGAAILLLLNNKFKCTFPFILELLAEITIPYFSEIGSTIS